ncbi:MAG: AAA family ATPase [Prolixibacteraceae bacterium]|nr:AAA family ATPase [Prolixibacteraceae bacterium]
MDNKKLKLSRITIKGYKSFSNACPVDIDLSNITVLLGANGSGKSNLISFFKMLNFMMSGSFQNYIELNGTADTFLHYGAKRTKHISGELYFENLINTDLYSFTLSHATPDRLIITSEEIEWLRKGESNRKKISMETNFKESSLYKTNGVIEKIIWNVLSRCRVFQFHDTSAESFLRKPSHIAASDYLLSEGGNLSAFLWNMRQESKNHYDRIVSYIQVVMPQFGDFLLEPNSNGFVMLKWKDNSANDYILLPQQISDGSLRFIALATLLLQTPEKMPTVIILDEPELGLHPLAIVQLAEMIKQASEHAQIILATQSPRLVDEFDASDIVVMEREDNYSICKRLDTIELKDWLDSYTVSELWDKNVIGGRP